MQVGVPDTASAFGGPARDTAAAVGAPAAAIGGPAQLLHIEMDHVPRPGGSDLVRDPAGVLAAGSEIPQPGDPESVQPSAHGAQMQVVALGVQVVMAASGGPLSIPEQGLDQFDDLPGGLLRAEAGSAGAVLETGGAFGAVAGHPGVHGGPADAELGGHVGDRNPVVQGASARVARSKARQILPYFLLLTDGLTDDTSGLRKCSGVGAGVVEAQVATGGFGREPVVSGGDGDALGFAIAGKLDQVGVVGQA